MLVFKKTLTGVSDTVKVGLRSKLGKKCRVRARRENAGEA